MDIRVVNLSYFIPKAAPTGKATGHSAPVSGQAQDDYVCLLNSVNVEFRKGTVTALMGPSGAGCAMMHNLT
jgi:ABC-type multidrug transport system ATPase subunit